MKLEDMNQKMNTTLTLLSQVVTQQHGDGVTATTGLILFPGIDDLPITTINDLIVVDGALRNDNDFKKSLVCDFIVTINVDSIKCDAAVNILFTQNSSISGSSGGWCRM